MGSGTYIASLKNASEGNEIALHCYFSIVPPPQEQFLHDFYTSTTGFPPSLHLHNHFYSIPPLLFPLHNYTSTTISTPYHHYCFPSTTTPPRPFLLHTITTVSPPQLHLHDRFYSIPPLLFPLHNYTSTPHSCSRISFAISREAAAVGVGYHSHSARVSSAIHSLPSL